MTALSKIAHLMWSCLCASIKFMKTLGCPLCHFMVEKGAQKRPLCTLVWTSKHTTTKKSVEHYFTKVWIRRRTIRAKCAIWDKGYEL